MSLIVAMTFAILELKLELIRDSSQILLLFVLYIWNLRTAAHMSC